MATCPPKAEAKTQITSGGVPVFEIIVRRLPAPEAQDHNGEGAK